ncbi:hypothetical protein L1887_06723 [Cichorium endivia]|nr:hypothetical protein L1887_06723 [Cichorium endivia]
MFASVSRYLYWNLSDTDRVVDELEEILMAASDTFRVAASDQLEIWAERTGCEIVSAEKEKAKASSVLSQAVKKGKEQGLHTNYSLMEELIACKKAVAKIVPVVPNRRAQLRQAIVDSEAELAAICSAMGERPVHIRQSDQTPRSLKEELRAILPELEEMKNRKCLK